MEPIYVVLIINLIVWSGLFIQLTLTGRQIKELKAKVTQLEKGQG